MKLSDIIALAKNGYKPSDIKELVALAEETKEEPEETKEEPEETKEEPEETKEEPEETKEEPDYKSLYLKSQEELKAAQAENRKSKEGKTEPKTDYEKALAHFNSILK